MCWFFVFNVGLFIFKGVFYLFNIEGYGVQFCLFECFWVEILVGVDVQECFVILFEVLLELWFSFDVVVY